MRPHLQLSSLPLAPLSYPPVCGLGTLQQAAEEVTGGTQFVTVSVLVVKAAGPAIERAVAGIFVMTASRIVATFWPQVLGIIAGTVIEPDTGSLVGWAVATGGALALDYLSNSHRERLDRPDFERRMPKPSR